MTQTSNSRQALWLGMGSFFSFLVGIISPMILSRVFTKADYGTYKQVMYVYSTLLFVFTLGLPKAYAYFLPKFSREYSRDIINKITKLFIGLGFLFSLALYSFSNPISKILNNPDLSLALKFFSPTPVFLLPTLGLDGIYAAFRRTHFITIYTVLTRTLTVALTVIPVFFMNGSYIHAIVGFDIASLLACMVALILKSSPVRKESHQKSTLSYKQIFHFSVPLMIASFWGVIFSSANQFFVSRYYGSEVFADFSNGFMEIPFATMVISAVTAVLLPRFSEMDEGKRMNNEIYTLWLSALEKSAKIIFPILIFSIVFSRLIMTCLYGNTYGTSSIYFKIKNISSLLYIVPFAPIILAIGKTKAYANIHMVAAIILVMLEYICVKTIDSPIAIAIISESVQAMKIYLMLRVIAHYSGRALLELIPVKPLLKILLTCLFAAILTYAVTFYIPSSKWLLAIICVSVFLLFYYVICHCVRLSYKEIAAGLLPGFCRPVIKYLP